MFIIFQKDSSIKRIEAFADTHGRHRKYQYDRETTDILVCAGEVCDIGKPNRKSIFSDMSTKTDNKKQYLEKQVFIMWQ